MPKVTLMFEDKEDGSGVNVWCNPPLDQLLANNEDTSNAKAYALYALKAVRKRAEKKRNQGHSLVRPR